MDFILFDIIAALTGWLYLRLRYLDKDIRSTMLHEAYMILIHLQERRKGSRRSP